MYKRQEEDQATVETDKNKAQGDVNHPSSQEQDDQAKSSKMPDFDSIEPAKSGSKYKKIAPRKGQAVGYSGEVLPP